MNRRPDLKIERAGPAGPWVPALRALLGCGSPKGVPCDGGQPAVPGPIHYGASIPRSPCVGVSGPGCGMDANNAAVLATKIRRGKGYCKKGPAV